MLTESYFEQATTASPQSLPALTQQALEQLRTDERDEIKIDIDRKLDFLSFAKTHFISALKNTGIGPLLKSVDAAYAAATADLSTPPSIEYVTPGRRSARATRTESSAARRSACSCANSGRRETMSAVSRSMRSH